MSGSNAAAGPLSVLTPYLFPSNSKKVPNLGDGFILRAIERRLGPFAPDRQFTSRAAPTPAQQDVLLGSRGVILAGANQLDDHFSPWPGLDATELSARPFVLLPMGVGVHGDPHRNHSMSDATRAVLTVMHQRIRFSSWRCPRTVAYLERSMPELAPQLLMTGCPVVYDRPLLESTRFHDGRDVIAVTATERGDFWDRESRTIDFVARRFAHAEKWFVVHQDYAVKRKAWWKRGVATRLQKTPASLQAFAERRGFVVQRPTTLDDGVALYERADLHFGSRLHAHLLMLSQNKRSYLTKVDERAVGIAEHLDFPLCDPERFDDVCDYDFERVRQKALVTFTVMQRFVDSVGRTC